MTLPWKALAKKYFQERLRLQEALAEPVEYITKLDDKEFWEHIEKALPPVPTREPQPTHAELMRQIEQTVKGPK